MSLQPGAHLRFGFRGAGVEWIVDLFHRAVPRHAARGRSVFANRQRARRGGRNELGWRFFGFFHRHGDHFDVPFDD